MQGGARRKRFLGGFILTGRWGRMAGSGRGIAGSATATASGGRIAGIEEKIAGSIVGSGRIGGRIAGSGG